MKIKLLGQAGVQIDLKNGTRILFDPYLTDTLHETRGDRFTRLVPPPEDIAALNPDILAITHNHGDHLDMATLEHWLDGQRVYPVLGPYSVYKLIASRWPSKHNVMVMRPGVEVTLGQARFCAVPASHETPEAVGYLLKAEGRTIYLSGDTLYYQAIPEFLRRESIDLALLCINGFGNNMNAQDAARLAETLRAKLAIPIHWDLFAPFGEDPREFVSALQTVPAKILNAYEALEL